MKNDGKDKTVPIQSCVPKKSNGRGVSSEAMKEKGRNLARLDYQKKGK